MSENDQPSRRIRIRFHPEAARALRAGKALKQIELAADLKLGEATIGRIERGEDVSIHTASVYCKYFEIADLESIADIVGPDEKTAFKPSKPLDSYLFEDMLRELTDIIGEEPAKAVMDNLFSKMRNFRFKSGGGRLLRRIKRYDIDGFITILAMRAASISGHLDSIMRGQLKLYASSTHSKLLEQEEASALAASWKDRFMNLHNEHVEAIKAGELLIAHEIRREISELLLHRSIPQHKIRVVAAPSHRQ